MTDPVAFATYCANIPPASGGPAIPMGPREANVGTVDFTNPAAPMGVPLAWTDETGVSSPVPVFRENGIVSSVLITENPRITGSGAPIEEWNIYNFTVDGHPVHMHLVRFNVIDRQPIPGVILPTTPFPYMTVADAYAAAGAGALIDANAVQALPAVTFGAAYAVTVTGGYNGDFSAVTGMTTPGSPVSFEGGAVTISNIMIQ